MGHINVLIIDDDIDDREILGDVLRAVNKDVNIDEAIDGLSGLSLLHDPSRTLPDIIFLDLNMPRLSGFELLAKIKQHAVLNSVPVCIYSTSQARSDRDKAMSLGAHSVITKTFDLPVLRQQLAELFSTI